MLAWLCPVSLKIDVVKLRVNLVKFDLKASLFRVFAGPQDILIALHIELDLHI